MREVASLPPEEEENFVAFDTERGRNAKYVILTDPLDGSSNIDVNVAVGTIFSDIAVYPLVHLLPWKIFTART